MQYNNWKIHLFPYQEKNQENLLNIVIENPQGFLVSDSLVSALTQKLDNLDAFHRVWIIESEKKEKIGVAILQKINQEHQTAQLLIACNDSETCKNIKLFREIYDFVAKYAFEELNLFRLQVEVLENNLKLKKAYKKIGFVEEGLLRSKYKIQDKFHDVFIMSMLKIEWERLQK